MFFCTVFSIFLRNPHIEKLEREEPAVYAHLVAVTEKAIRPVQKEVRIIGGSISGGGICNSYIRGLFESGIADPIDIFSYHPYGSIPELYWPEQLLKQQTVPPPGTSYRSHREGDPCAAIRSSGKFQFQEQKKIKTAHEYLNRALELLWID